MKKGDIVEGIIEAVDFPNNGILNVDGKKIIVKNAIPGQVVRGRVNKKKAGKIEAALLEVLQRSPVETCAAGCSLFPDCGGCLYRTMEYSSQLQMKEQQIRRLMEDALRKSGQEPASVHFEPVHASPSRCRYRNKMEYSFGDSEKGGPLTLGLHKRNSTYDILTASDCQIVAEDFNRILHAVLEFCRKMGWGYYHKISHEGYLRHLLLRRSEADGSVLVDLVTSSQYLSSSGEENSSFLERQVGDESGSREAETQGLKKFCEMLLELKLDGKITGILHTVNDSVADAVKNDRTDLLYGKDYLTESLLGLQFKITPFSFFQTNSRGAEILYSVVREYLEDAEGKTVFDLYSGTGTIAQILAPAAGKVIGVEIVEEAVEAAKENAARNGLNNCSFLAGDVLKVLDDISEKPDLIVLDPPRDGIHPKALPKILAYQVPEIIYISCKATSLARDLPAFEEQGYRMRRCTCVDLFPDSAHVETVCLLSKLHEAKHHVNVKLDMDELDLTSAEAKATYKEIGEWVQEKYGFHVTNLNIAQVKQKHGIIERENYNKPKSENSRQPGCPEEKVKAIEDALRHFQMI